MQIDESATAVHPDCLHKTQTEWLMSTIATIQYTDMKSLRLVAALQRACKGIA